MPNPATTTPDATSLQRNEDGSTITSDPPSRNLSSASTDASEVIQIDTDHEDTATNNEQGASDNTTTPSNNASEPAATTTFGKLNKARQDEWKCVRMLDKYKPKKSGSQSPSAVYELFRQVQIDKEKVCICYL